jgi:hypothetical protein
MKYLHLLLTPVLLCVPLLALSFGQTPHAEERLSIYGSPTQIGTIAYRASRDSDGRILKEIFYMGNRSAHPPYTEDMLVVQSIVLHKYDDQSSTKRAEHYNARMNLEYVWETKYDNHKDRRETKFTRDGVRQYEIRYLENRSVSHLYYDESGENLVAIRGLIPKDADLPSGWGDSQSGLACGIVLTRAKSQVDDLPGYALYVNVKNSGSTQMSIPQLPPAEIELRDGAGALVRQRTDTQDPLQAQRLFYGQLINPGESGNTYPAYELKMRYANLAPGRYSIRVKQSIEGRDQPLISNTVFFEVVGQKK